jgi:predicted nucleotidyltransferase
MNQIIESKREALAALCRRYGVRRLELFGSVTTDAFDPARSDLDFLVEFDALPPVTLADAYFGLKDSLEALFGRPVDLVTESSLSNPYFRERVMAERQAVYAR